MNSNTKKIVMASILASLCCVATLFIKVPSPFKGYLNLGDCIVLIAGWLMTPHYSFLSAGIGSALADILSGYTIYAPATFIIKGLMAIIAHKTYKKMNSKVLSGIFAEMIMVLGYFVFEACLYGSSISFLNIPMNMIQGVFGLAVALQVIKLLEKTNVK